MTQRDVARVNATERPGSAELAPSGKILLERLHFHFHLHSPNEHSPSSTPTTPFALPSSVHSASTFVPIAQQATQHSSIELHTDRCSLTSRNPTRTTNYNMADQINMNGLSLHDSQHAPQGNGFGERSAYIPPHLRQRGGGPPAGMENGGPPPAPMSNGLNGSAWAQPQQ